MTLSIRTGNRARLLFDRDAGQPNVIPTGNVSEWRLLSIAPHSWDRPVVLDSSLDSSGFDELLGGDLMTVEPLIVQIMPLIEQGDTTGGAYRPDPTDAVAANADSFLSIVGTVHLLFPPAESTATSGYYTLAGSGFFTNWQNTGFSNNERQLGANAFQFDGKAHKPRFYEYAATP